jgi:hemerythrin superfamily protein
MAATSAASSGKKSAAKSAAKSKTGKTSSARLKTQQAITLLKADHRAVEKLFAQFEKATDNDQKKQIFDQINLALKVHTQIEEEIFYPVSREYLEGEEEDMVDEAVVEHAAAKDLMAEIEAMQPGEDLYDAKVKVLSEQIEHHVEEEEKEYFPECLKTEMDMKEVGERLKSRKEELMAQMGGDQDRAVQ